MSATPINYAAVLADLEAKRVQLDSAIAAIKASWSKPEPWPQLPRLFRVLTVSL